MSLNGWRSIWNCPTLKLPLLSYQCPETWQAMSETGDPNVRNCSACQKEVRLCHTPQEFIQAAEEGHCVAIPRAVLPIHLKALQVGQPSAESAAEFKAQIGELVAWWSSVVDQVPEALGTELEPMRERIERRRNNI